jgi:hypothetical protein
MFALMEHRESSTKQPDASLADCQAVTSMEVTSNQDANSIEKNPSGDTSDSGNASDNDGHVKIGAEVALAGMGYDFGQSKVTRARITSLENSAHYFSKGFAQPPSVESVPILRKMRLLCSKISSLLALVYLRIRFLWKFCANFRYSCIS